MRKKIEAFFKSEMAGGVATLLAAAMALLLANSGAAEAYFGAVVYMKHAVNDGLMVVFFLVVAMELKKEMLVSKPSLLVLPLVAAIGGMVVPALVYLGFGGDVNGWAIPTATDIAFALSILLVFGSRLPHSLRIFLLSIAIFDDLGAILIIAFYYSHGVQLIPLAMAAILVLMMYIAKKENAFLYLLMGAILAALLHEAGIHTTIAGVITGLMLPDKTRQKLFHALHKWSAFLIIPLFALVNAGISFAGIGRESLLDPVPLGIALGLLLGKQLGIFGAAWCAIKLKIAKMPAKARWVDVYAVSVIAGIGFTMSIFIGMLAFTGDAMQVEVKLGVLFGSLLSALLGIIILKLAPAAE